MIKIDTSNQCVWHDQIMVDLQPRTFSLLIYLFRNRGRLVTKSELLDQVWGDACVGEHAIKTAVSDLRKMLGDSPRDPAHIQTLHRRGYRFISAATTELPGKAA